jgi:hypothetical protein
MPGLLPHEESNKAEKTSKTNWAIFMPLVERIGAGMQLLKQTAMLLVTFTASGNSAFSSTRESSTGVPAQTAAAGSSSCWPVLISFLYSRFLFTTRFILANLNFSLAILALIESSLAVCSSTPLSAILSDSSMCCVRMLPSIVVTSDII